MVNVVAVITLCWAVSSTAYANSVGASCTITEFSQVANAVKSCTNIVVKNLNVPAKKTLHLNLKQGTSLTFEGITTFGVANWQGPLVKIEGTQLKVKGAIGNRLDGQGAKYWDGKGGQGSTKPVLIEIKGGGTFDDINLLNCPERCVALMGNQASLSGWNIDVSAGDKNNLGHNTDGFDITGDGVTIKNSVVKNQDDCVVVNKGKNMHFKNIYCSGGHGLSLAVGMSKTSYNDNVVSNITFSECTVVNSVNGIHVKTVKDGTTGVIQDIIYTHITLQGITEYGIRVHQDYPDNDQKPVGNVPIKGLTISDVKGTVSGKFSSSVNVVCASGACSNWKWSDINITGGKYPCSMNYKPSGFSC